MINTLPSFKVLDSKQDEYDNFQLFVETVAEPYACTSCGCISNLYKWGSKRQIFMDIPHGHSKVALILNRRRYRCRECDATFFEPLPDIDDKRLITNRLLKYIQLESIKRTFLSIANDVGVDEKTVRNIFRDYVNELESMFRFEVPRWLGIDEIHILKKPRCVITNVEENTMINLLRDRNKPTVIKYLSELKNKHNVKYVATDMWQPYKDAVNEVMPWANQVVDKYHVIAYANKALESTRKTIRQTLTDKQRKKIMHDRFVLLKNKEDLIPEQILNRDIWFVTLPALKTAYYLKESLRDLYTFESRNDASKAFQEWKNSIPDNMVHFKEIAKTFTNWEDEILNYFDHRITNAYTETLNGLIRVINHLGRGYSFEALRAKILFTNGIHKSKSNKHSMRSVIRNKNVMAYTIPLDMCECLYDSLGVDISTIIYYWGCGE
jgi:transposase